MKQKRTGELGTMGHDTLTPSYLPNHSTSITPPHSYALSLLKFLPSRFFFFFPTIFNQAIPPAEAPPNAWAQRTLALQLGPEDPSQLHSVGDRQHVPQLKGGVAFPSSLGSALIQQESKETPRKHSMSTA